MSQTLTLPDEIQAQIDSARIVIFHSSLTDIRGLVSWLTDQELQFRLIELSMADPDQRLRFEQLREAVNWPHLPMIFLEGRLLGGEPELRQALAEAEPVRNRWMAWLGYGGLIPIVVCVLLQIAGPQSWRQVVQVMLLGYGAVILSFVGAIHWGWVIAGGATNVSPVKRLCWSVIPALIGWVSLGMPFRLGALLQALLFVLAWKVDHDWYPQRRALTFFRKLRTHLTIGMTISLLIAAMMG